MHSYYHCVPGRMRVKIPALKHQPDRGEEVKRVLRGMDGVSAVAFTPLTGSVVVLFDQDRIGPEQISGCLKDGGLNMFKVAVGWAIGKALEANGLSLLAALI
jgi:copper chaperone CopZ